MQEEWEMQDTTTDNCRPYFLWLLAGSNKVLSQEKYYKLVRDETCMRVLELKYCSDKLAWHSYTKIYSHDIGPLPFVETTTMATDTTSK